MAIKKYNRLTNNFKPNLEEYERNKLANSIVTDDGTLVVSSDFYRDADSLEYSQNDVVEAKAVDRLVADLDKQLMHILILQIGST